MSTGIPRLFRKLSSIPDRFFVLAARISMAAFFIRAGQTKVLWGDDGLALTSGAKYLFEQEYKVPVLPYETAAWLATGAEHLFPVLLIAGLATRLSALGLLGMTLVIQVFVYPGSWPDHLLWATALLFIAARGPGPLALDNVICKKMGG
ncbi:DoxX family protein [Pseudomonadota bacterium]